MDRTQSSMSGDLALPPELVTAHAASLRALACSLARDAHAADDVVQETWLRALTSPPVERENVGGWLRRVVAGFASKRHRSEARRTDRERKYALERPEATNDAHTRADTLRAVVDAVLSLEEPYRETVLLRWFEALPPRDIAVRQGTAIATVNSRLQRAHARLRESLSRRLDLDERKLHGVLLALFGVEATRTAAAASLSFMGTTMTMKLISVAGLSAAVLGAVLYFEQSSDDRKPMLEAAPAASTQSPESENLGIDALDTSEPTRVAANARAGAAAEEVINAPAPAPHAFDVTFVVLDERGVPRPRASVWIGPDLERTAHLGQTGWDGELHSTWRSDEAVLDLVLELRGNGVISGGLRHIVLHAGAPERILIAADSPAAPPPDVAAAMFAVKVTSEEEPTAVFGFGLTVGEPVFKTDALGNAVIVDPWLLNRRVTEPNDIASGVTFALAGQSIERPSLGGLMLLDKTVAEETQGGRIRGTVVDQDARPLPGVRVMVLAEKGIWKSDAATDLEGAFEITDVPAGRALCFAGGGPNALQRVMIEDLKAGEARALRIVCPTAILTPLRLVDRAGAPLGGWRIEARRCDRNESFVERIQLDDDGRGMMSLPLTESVRLYAGPRNGSETPALLLERNFVASGRATELVVRDDVRPASYAIEVHARGSGDHSYSLMRLWRVDSGLGRPAELENVEGIGDDINKSTLRGTGLLPGSYFIEYGSRGARWKRIGPYVLAAGEEFRLGPIVLDEPAQVEISAAKPERDTLLRATTRKHGLRYQSPPLKGRVPSTLHFASGDYELSVTFGPKSDQPRKLVRELRLASDERRKLELEAPK